MRCAGEMPDPRLAPLVLSEDERHTLENWAKRRSTAQGLALRGRIVMEIYTQVPDKTTRDTLKRLSDWLGQAGDEAGPRGAEDGQEDDTSGRPGPRDGTPPDGS